MSKFHIKIDSGLNNIWRYAAFYPPVKEENRLTLGEGNTPELYGGELASSLGFSSLIFKREDSNPNGSHKDRMLAYQVSRAKESGAKALIISSSGNAAVSAAAYCKKADITLFAFISPKTDESKIARIADFGAFIIMSKYALTLSDLASKNLGIKNLRPGKSDNAFQGLKSIAFELFEHCHAIDAIFVPTSSASTLLGISSAYNDLLDLGEARKIPALYVVQTAYIHPIAATFDRNFIGESESVARGIINREIDEDRLMRILKFIKTSNGGGAVVSNHNILEAKEALARTGIISGYESAAGLAGAIKSADKLENQRVVVLLTGSMPEGQPEYINRENIFEANDIEYVEKIIKTVISD